MPKRSITLRPENGPTSITAINCGSSNPRLGGTVNLSTFPNLQNFTCTYNNITNLVGTANLPALTSITLTQNLLSTFPNLGASTGLEIIICDGTNPAIRQFTGSFPNLATYTNLKTYNGLFCGFSGSLPSLSANTALTYFNCSFNSLSGNLPDLSANTALTEFYCYRNNTSGSGGFSGSLPSLGANTALTNFECFGNSFTGSPPVLPPSMKKFLCRFCALDGSIPNFPAGTQIMTYDCGSNKLIGDIPSLINVITLNNFACYDNKLTGFSGGVRPGLLNFAAENNLLTQVAVDAILAAFVAANGTGGTRTLNLGGTGNAVPTGGQNNSNRLTLLSRGWTVTVNG